MHNKHLFLKAVIILSVTSLVKGFVSDEIIDTYCKQGLFFDRIEEFDSINNSRLSYESLVAKAARRRWAIPITASYFFGNNAFDNCSRDTNLASVFLGKDVTIADTSLFCRLSADNKVRSINQPALGFDRGANPISVGAPFGAYRDDLVSTLLAPMKVDFDIDRRSFECDVTALYRWWFGNCDQFLLTCGITIPFKSIHYSLNPLFVGGSLYRDTSFTTAVTQREDQLKAFFREYSSIEDFFIRGILGKKNITFNKSIQHSGIGDIALFSVVDCAQCFPNVIQTMQWGAALIVPSGGPINQSTLFAPALGQGCFAGDLFINIVFNSSLQAFNPFIRGALEISAPFSFGDHGVRVPTLIEQNQTRVQVKTVPGLKTLDIRLQNFENYWVDSFSEFDSTVPLLADSTTSALSVKQGTQFIFGFGNYAYNVAYTKARLALLYSYMYRQQHAVSGKCPQFNSKALVLNTSAQSHTFSWSLSWPGKIVDFYAGSEHVFAGQNVIRDNRLFASCVITF